MEKDLKREELKSSDVFAMLCSISDWLDSLTEEDLLDITPFDVLNKIKNDWKV